MDEEMWRNTRLSPSPPPAQNPRSRLFPAATAPAAASCGIMISTALSLNSSGQLVAGAAPEPCYSSDNNDGPGAGGLYCNSGAAAAAGGGGGFFAAACFSNGPPALGCADEDAASAGRRRALEQALSKGGGGAMWSGADRRNKRMIKNRESAARSRARKQAHMNELQKEVRLLVEENAKLREQYEELKEATAAHQLHPKRPLQRVLSAPF